MKPQSLHSLRTRRSFLRTAGAGAAGLLLLDAVLADPYAPVRFLVADTSPVRIRGRVSVDGKGMQGIAVSDGISVVATGPDGSYELHSTTRQEFVSCTLPGNVRIPRADTGTARHFAPIVPASDGTLEASWELQEDDRDLSRHGFLLLADPQTLDAEDMARFHAETVPDVLRTVEGSDVPLFAVGCGDLMFDKLEFFPDYEKAVQLMGIPAFQVLGNHDVEVAATSDGPSAATFKRFFGPNYYSFDRGDVHYVVLDDVLWYGRGYIGYIDDLQLEWLRQDLTLVEKGRRVVVFVHIPVYCKQHERRGERSASNSEVVTNREALYRILEGYAAHVVCGHMHESEHLADGGMTHHVCGAVCGGWWTGDICGDGTPNGYGVYTFSGASFTEYYKGTNRDPRHQMRMYRPGADMTFPDDILVNVWNASDAWTIHAVESGIRTTLRADGPLKDPIAARLLDGKDRPRKHAWVEADPSTHIFRYTPRDASSTVVVEAIDASGETYMLDTFTPVESR